MERSESIKELAAALAKAQGEMQMAAKDADNTFFKSKYADLASLVASIKVALSGNGLAYVQFPLTNDKAEAGIETMLMHSSGEWVKGEAFFVPVSKADAQGFGSCITYLRRYSLAAITGNAPDDDDDGNAASKNAPKKAIVPALDPVAREKLINDQCAKLDEFTVMAELKETAMMYIAQAVEFGDKEGETRLRGRYKVCRDKITAAAAKAESKPDEKAAA